MSLRLHRLVPVTGIAAVLVGALATTTPALAQGGGGLVGSGSGTPPASVITSSGAPLTPAVLPDGTGTISGTIVDELTGAPLIGAVVSLSVASRAAIGRNIREITDGRGRFAFTKLPAHDDYQVAAAMPGYFDGTYGQTSLRPPSTTPRIALGEGQWFPNANISLGKGGSISGTVYDERGEPVVGVFVHVFAQVLVSGLKQLASGPSATTDDRGAYRIPNLGPGDYLVSVPSVAATVPVAAGTVTGSTIPYATFDPDSLARLALGKYPIPPPPQDGRRFTYPPAYAPDAPTPARATAVQLALGEARPNVDIRLAPAPGSTIRGRVEAPVDPLPSITLRLLPAGLENLGVGGEAATAMVAPDGSFTFLNVAPGAYTIDVRRTSMEFSYSATGGSTQRLPLPPGSNSFSINTGSVDSAPAGVQYTSTTISRGEESDLWGRASVTVAGDVTSVIVPLRHGSTIAGRGTRETKDPVNNAAPFPLGLRAEPADGSPSTGLAPNSRPLDDPMAFELSGLTPGRYVLRFSRQAPGTIVKAITIAGEDFTDRPIDLTDGRDVTNVAVVFTDQVPMLNGTVRPGEATNKDLSVIAFPVQPDQWSNYGLTPVRIKTSSASAQGSFHLSSLPEGDYFVVAVPTSDVDAWQDPEFLKTAARTAARVSLKWGQSATVEAPLVRVR
jgi:hypothetical protein